MTQRKRADYLIFIIGLLLAPGIGVGCLKTRSQWRSSEPANEEKRKEGESIYSVPAPQEIKLDAQYQIDEIKQELTLLQGRFENQGRRFDEKNSEEKDFKKRIFQLEEQQKKVQQNLEDLKKKLWQDPEKLFQKAEVSYTKKHYEEAFKLLEDYLELPHLKNEEQASFLKAQCLVHLQQHQKAIVEFSNLLEKKPSESLRPALLYQIGCSFEALKLKTEADGFFQELLESYPESAESKKRKKSLSKKKTSSLKKKAKNPE